jgi:hypothetical protein
VENGMTTLTIDLKDWEPIRQRLRRDFGDSMILLSFKMKRELGFTVRRHAQWDESKYKHIDDIRLDFDDESKAVWFRLKYL